PAHHHRALLGPGPMAGNDWMAGPSGAASHPRGAGSDLAQARIELGGRRGRRMVAGEARRIECRSRRGTPAADHDRIDLIDEGDAETVVLLPGDRTVDPPDIAQFDPHQRAADDL